MTEKQQQKDSPANATAEEIVDRLPVRAMLTARDVADALALATTAPVVAAVDSGALQAVRLAGQYRISRREAARWIRSLGA